MNGELLYGEYKDIREHLMELARRTLDGAGRDRLIAAVTGAEAEPQGPMPYRTIIRDALAFLMIAQNEHLGIYEFERSGTHSQPVRTAQ